MQLRRQALESGKTMSRKARARLESQSITSSPLASPGGSRPPSRAPSRNNSRPPSRVPSTAGSDNGEDDVSEISEWTQDHDTVLTEAQFDELFDEMEDREFFKGNAKGRALTLSKFANSIAAHFIADEKQSRLEDLLPILVRSVKDSSHTACKLPALRGIAISIITIGDDDGSLFMRLKEVLQEGIYDSSSAKVQAASLRVLSAITFFSAADYQETVAVMDFLLRIVETDGEHVDALDNSEVVATAIQEWAFLSTLLAVDVSISSKALEAFGDQLESSAPEVLMAASQGIALIYESAYALKGPDDSNEEVSIDVSDEEEKVAGPYRRQNWVHNHTFTNENDYDIKAKLKTLSTSAMHHAKKDIRKELRATFRDVSHAIDHPWRGPHFSTAMDGDSFLYYGHRLRQGNMMIDRWWKLHRSASIKRILRNGIGEHIMYNPAVEDALRNCLEAPSRFKHGNDHGHALLEDASSDNDDVPDQPDLGDVASDGSDEEQHEDSLQHRMSRLRVR